MDIYALTKPVRTTPTMRARTANAAQASAPAAAPARSQDTAVFSADAASSAPDGSTATTFPSFADAFRTVMDGYSAGIRAYYAEGHAENLTFDNPAAHIWDKYKNPVSPDFRAGLSEDERAWAYDQELDLLNGGRHLQMRNPYAFEGEPPTLAQAAMKANQETREQLDRSVQGLLSQEGITLPEGASFRLTVDAGYTIHVTGLEDEPLTEAVENALNRGENGKNLYEHLQLCNPAGFGFEEPPQYAGGALSVDYADGHLLDVDTEYGWGVGQNGWQAGADPELSDEALASVKRGAGTAWARFSELYDPHLESMSGEILNAKPPFDTQEAYDRLCAAVRVGAPEVIAQFRAESHNLNLIVNKNQDIDPDGSVAAKAYMESYAQQAAQTRQAIGAYYAEAHAENRALPLTDALDRLAQKYLRPGSALFRAGLPEAQRQMAYRQERALLTGGRLMLADPYALASTGGVPNPNTMQRIARQAAQDALDALRLQSGG